METPCVRVPREDGEATRADLEEHDLLAHDYEIVVADGDIYIPVTDPTAVPEDLPVVSRDVPARETQTLPEDVLGFEPSYERLGGAAILDEDDPDRAQAIADALVDSSIPVETVLNRASKVKGTERLREWDLLYGDDTETVHREYGCVFALDVTEVYFSPRLATERHRVVEQVDDGDQVLDMFAGVGPFAVPMAKAGGTAVGVDINDRAIDYLRTNAERNDVADRVTGIVGDVQAVAADYEDWADCLVMNLPHSADEFLDTAVRLAGDHCRLHYYDIQHEDDPYGPGEAVIREAAEPDYDVTVDTRHTVRSYAPHELNVALDVTLSR